jgi:hypothetical protein
MENKDNVNGFVALVKLVMGIVIIVLGVQLLMM